jgi:hypothetical protein
MTNEIARQIADTTSGAILLYVFIGMLIGFGLIFVAIKKGGRK